MLADVRCTVRRHEGAHDRQSESYPYLRRRMPEAFGGALDGAQLVVEHALDVRALDFDQRVTAAWSALDSRNTLYYKMRKHGIRA